MKTYFTVHLYNTEHETQYETREEAQEMLLKLTTDNRDHVDENHYVEEDDYHYNDCPFSPSRSF